MLGGQAASVGGGGREVEEVVLLVLGRRGASGRAMEVVFATCGYCQDMLTSTLFVQATNTVMKESLGKPLTSTFRRHSDNYRLRTLLPVG